MFTRFEILSEMRDPLMLQQCASYIYLFIYLGQNRVAFLQLRTVDSESSHIQKMFLSENHLLIYSEKTIHNKNYI